MTTNAEHLQWIHDRLIQVHDEPENVDFLIRLRNIIEDVTPLRKFRCVIEKPHDNPRRRVIFDRIGHFKDEEAAKIATLVKIDMIDVPDPLEFKLDYIRQFSQ